MRTAVETIEAPAQDLLPGTVRVVTYNIHRGVGVDGKKDLGRIAAVLEEARPDVVALQEAEAKTALGRTSCQIEKLAERLGMKAVHGPTIVWHDGRYGNGVLTRFDPDEPQLVDLSHRRREPRGALLVRLATPECPLLVACTHLGLRAGEREAQVPRILEKLDGADAVVLAGDFNEWYPRSRVLGTLFRHFGPMPHVATYPSIRPLLALDRAFVTPRAALRSLHAHRSRLARIASDHLPLVAQVDLTEMRARG